MQRLNPSEIASLRHIRTCIRTNATQEQYRAFAKNIEAQDPDITILGRKAAIALAKRVTRLREHTWDMCPESCMAFVGPHANLQRCNSIRQGRRCGAARFDSKGKPRRTYSTLSILPRVRAKFASGSGSTYLHDQAEWSARTWGTDEHHFADWPDGACHQHLREKGFFDDPRHDAYVLSTDGAQFVSKRKSNGWIVMLSSLNELHTKRFKRPETFVSCVVPGPNNPVNVDSFLWPVVQELARAAHGYWIWDGAREEWFLWRAWLVATAADQQGSSKINHMTGPTGYCGCRNCHMVANYAYEGQSVGYFPLKTVKGDKARTRDRPQQYDPYDLPLRSEDSFEENLTELSNSLTAADRRETRRLTGVGGRPLLAFSPAFMVPLFFPVDVFHLFGSNIPSLIWNTLTTEEPDDPFPLTKEHQELFTTLLEQSARDLPSSFSNSAPRTPTTNAGSYYKMYEWTLVTYLYLPSFLYAIGAPLSLLQMLSHLQAGVRLAMSDRGISASELDDMHDHFVQFVRLWEQEFVRGKVSLLHRATISIHQLLHVRMFIYCHSNMRNTSQGRCEREVGHIKYVLQSFKSPFPSIARNVRELEHIRLLDLLLQDAEDKDDPSDVPTLATKISSKHRRMTQSQVDEEDALIRTFQEQGVIPTPLPPYYYRGKLEIPGTSTVRGSRIESDGARRCCHFFARHDDGISYGKAMHFICFGADQDLDDEAPVNDQAAFIIFRRLQDVVTAEGIIKGRWSPEYFILDIRTIIEPVAICEFGGWVYVLRRLSWLTDHDEAD